MKHEEKRVESAGPVVEEAVTEPKEDATFAVPKTSFLSGSIVLKASHLLIGFACVMALVVGGIFLGMWISNRPSDPDIDPNAKDYGDIYVSAGEVAPGSISAPGYSDVTFLAGVRDVQIILPNPEGNPCYFRFILILQESGETIYRSGLVPPGQAITDITLSRPLEAGLYPMEIRIETFSLETRSAMSGVTMDVNLTVR